METKKSYRVRPGLVVALEENKIFRSEEPLELTDAEYQRHAIQVETEEQYQARNKKAEGRRQKAEGGSR